MHQARGEMCRRELMSKHMRQVTDHLCSTVGTGICVMEASSRSLQLRRRSLGRCVLDNRTSIAMLIFVYNLLVKLPSGFFPRRHFRILGRCILDRIHYSTWSCACSEQPSVAPPWMSRKLAFAARRGGSSVTRVNWLTFSPTQNER